jgi:hypothetical protein
MPEPPPSQLRRLLKEHPHERPRFARAVASLLGAGLVALVALGFLVVWHLIRRGRLIRERLSRPRQVRLPEIEIEIETRTTRADGVGEQGPGPS